MRQSKAFDIVFMKVPNALLSFPSHILSIMNKQGSTIKPLQKSILKSDKTSSKNVKTSFQLF